MSDVAHRGPRKAQAVCVDAQTHVKLEGTLVVRSNCNTSLTLYNVDVAPPELQGSQPLMGIILQPAEISVGALPPLSPAGEVCILL